MNPSELISAVASDLELYVLSGQLNPDIIGDALADASFGDRIAGFDDLLMLHFLLQEETAAFAAALPSRLKNLRTGTATERTLTRSEVSERIDWGETLQARNERNPDDTTIFVTQSRYEEFNLPENLVLKATTTLLREGLEQWESELLNYEWGTQWQPNVIQRTREILERNRNLGRIREPTNEEPTTRMVTAAAQARRPLYREAAELYTKHDAITGPEVDAEILSKLLSETLIVPTDERGPTRLWNTLFELYVLFGVIRILESLLDQPASLEPIQAGRDAVATFAVDPKTTLSVYYNQAAVTAGFSFLGQTEETDLTRREEVERRYVEIANRVPGMAGRQSTDRPDVLLVVERDGTVIPELAFPIECKYQKSQGGDRTVKQGIREVLEYIAYMRHGGELVYPGTESWYGTIAGAQGALVINDRPDPIGSLTTPAIDIHESQSMVAGLQDTLRSYLDRLSV